MRAKGESHEERSQLNPVIKEGQNGEQNVRQVGRKKGEKFILIFK